MTERILVNGAERDLPGGDLAALLAQLGVGPDRRGVAVAVNGEVVRRDAWSGRSLRPGDEVEVIEATQGG